MRHQLLSAACLYSVSITWSDRCLLSEKHESLNFDLSMDIKSYSFKIQLIDLSLVRIFILCAFEGEDK